MLAQWHHAIGEKVWLQATQARRSLSSEMAGQLRSFGALTTNRELAAKL